MTPPQSADGLREQIEALLDNDPVCNGRVSCATVEAIAALQSLPHTEGQSGNLEAVVDAAVEAWHDSSKPLHQWLGWTWAEYRAWVADATAIPRIPKHYATPTITDVQEAIERQFKLGERVEKIKGSSWRGRIVGFYSTALTPEGYAIESENESGSVQIYPASAIRSLAKQGENNAT